MWSDAHSTVPPAPQSGAPAVLSQALPDRTWSEGGRRVARTGPRCRHTKVKYSTRSHAPSSSAVRSTKPRCRLWVNLRRFGWSRTRADSPGRDLCSARWRTRLISCSEWVTRGSIKRRSRWEKPKQSVSSHKLKYGLTGLVWLVVRRVVKVLEWSRVTA